MHKFTSLRSKLGFTLCVVSVIILLLSTIACATEAPPAPPPTENSCVISCDKFLKQNNNSLENITIPGIGPDHEEKVQQPLLNAIAQSSYTFYYDIFPINAFAYAKLNQMKFFQATILACDALEDAGKKRYAIILHNDLMRFLQLALRIGLSCERHGGADYLIDRIVQIVNATVKNGWLKL